MSTSDVDRILAQIGVDLNPAATDGAAWTTLCEWRERVTAVLEAQRALAGAEWATPKERLRAQRSDKREELGRLVRDVWMDWAREQPDAKPHWLTPWEELEERHREVDRRIGMAIAALSAPAAPRSEAAEELHEAVEDMVSAVAVDPTRIDSPDFVAARTRFHAHLATLRAALLPAITREVEEHSRSMATMDHNREQFHTHTREETGR